MAQQISRTALGSAFIRGYHSEHDDIKIFDDFLANALLGQEELSAFYQYYVGLIKTSPETYAKFPSDDAVIAWLIRSVLPSSLMLSRARFAEDCLEVAILQGIQQYVILGAGMDTFAFRRPDIRVNIFEVDLPDIQGYKQERIKQLEWNIPPHLHFVPIDFSRERLSSALQKAQYQQTPTFFSWLGVTMYLPGDSVFNTLRDIASLSTSGSSVVFDYFDDDAFNPQKAASRVQGLMRSTQKLGEPIITGFDPSALEAQLQSLGFKINSHLAPAEIQALYFANRSDGYYALEHAHFIWAEKA